jgi:hypothetical protein
VADTDGDSDGIPDCKDVDADGDGMIDSYTPDTAAPVEDASVDVPVDAAAGAVGAVGADAPVDAPADETAMVPGPAEAPTVPEDSAIIDEGPPGAPTAEDTVTPAEDSAAGEVDAVTGDAVDMPDGLSAPAVVEDVDAITGGVYPPSGEAAAEPYSATDSVPEAPQVDDRAAADDDDTGGGGGGDDDF